METRVNPDIPLPVGEVLDAVPLRNESLRCEESGADSLLVYVPLRERWFMRPPISWIAKVGRERRIALDKLGREVWEACDGRRTAEQIIDLFANRHKLTFHEARLSVMEFLQQLTRRGMIVMVGLSKEQAA